MNEILQAEQKKFNKLYFKALKELEQYCQYCLRCLHRAGIHATPTDFVLLTGKRKNGNIYEALVYPKTAVVDGVGIVNPMFFYGFKFDYDFTDLSKSLFKVTFSENWEELEK